MLEWIRENKRWAQMILVLLILPFACTGIEGYRRMQGGADAVAKVSGHPISQAEYDNAMREQVSRLQQTFGPSFDARLLDTPEARRGVLDRLINQRALLTEANKTQFTVTNDELRKYLMAVPAFQENGQFSRPLFEQFLATQRLNGSEFDRRVREDLAVQRLATFTAESVVVPQELAQRLSEVLEQERTVRTAVYATSAYIDKVQVKPEAMKAYYEANKSSYELLERADIQYVVLNRDVVMKGVTLDPAEVKRYYEQNIAKFSTEEQRRARHILIGLAPTASPEQKKAAQAKAADLRGKLEKNPNEFEQLARQYSDDPGSKERGGDLDFFARKAMAKPFEDAVFALKLNEISSVVQTEFGFHIIQLTGIRPTEQRPFDAVKPDIEAELKQQLAAKKFEESAEIFKNTVYEQPDNLKAVADRLKLEVMTVNDFTRKDAAAKNPLLDSPKLIEAVFSDDVVKAKHNTPAVDVAPNTLIAARVLNYSPKSVQPFEAVEAQVKRAVQTRDARELAKKNGEQVLEALKANRSADVQWSDAKKVTRRSSAGLSSDALSAVMKVSTSRLPSYAGIDSGADGYSIYKIESVTRPPSDQIRVEALVQQLQRVFAEAENNAHIDAVRQRAKVEVLKAPAAQPASASTS